MSVLTLFPVLLGGVACGALLLRFVRRRASGAVVIALAVIAPLLAAYIFTLIAIETDYRDADGFLDCGIYCSAFQTALRWSFWVGGFLLVAASAAAGVLLVASRRDASR